MIAPLGVAEPKRYRFGVAMITAWTNIGASNPRIKRMISPFNFRIFTHFDSSYLERFFG
jgi:hypothetical protein